MLNQLAGRNRDNYFLAGSWGILFLSVFTLFSNFTPEAYYFFFNSDSLGLPVFFKDVFEEHGRLRKWSFAAAPTLFPDVSLYFILTRLLKIKFILAIIAYGLIQVTVITLLSVYIFRKSVPGKYQTYSWIIPLFLSMVLLETFYASYDPFMSFLLLSYSYHTGSFVNSLIFLAVYVSPARPVLKYIFLLLFSTIAAFSDKLFIVMLVIPLSVTLLLVYRKDEQKKSAFKTILFTIAGTLAGLGFYYLINKSRITTFSAPHKLYAFENMGDAATVFLVQVRSYFTRIGFKTIIVLLTFLSIPLSFIFILKKRNSENKRFLFFLVFYFLFVISVLLAPILNGNYTGWDTLRYSVSPFFFAAVMIALGFGMVLSRLKQKIDNLVTAGVFMGFLLLLSFKFHPSGIDELLQYYPEDVAEIDSVAEKYHLKRGVADYWMAKRAIMLSKKKAMVAPVYPDGSLNDYGASFDWFYNKTFDYIVADNLTPKEITKRFKIRDIIQTANCMILLVSPFTFPKRTFLPFTFPPGFEPKQ